MSVLKRGYYNFNKYDESKIVGNGLNPENIKPYYTPMKVILKEIIYGYVIFDEKNKTFDDGNGYGVNKLSQAYIYTSLVGAEHDLKNYDEPQGCKILEVKSTYECEEI